MQVSNNMAMKWSEESTAPAQSLLKFMDIASDAVKCALKKPTNFKRNINHRRYLQRQVKTFVKSRRSKNNCPRRKMAASANLSGDVHDLVREAIEELKFSNCYTGAGAIHREQAMAASPIAPPAFNVTPLDTSRSKNIPPTYRLRHFPVKPNGGHFNKPLACTQPHQCSLPGFMPAGPFEDDDLFMSVEELTNNIDINDLYIPELHEPRSPIVKCEDYFTESDLKIPSPLHGSTDCYSFQFNVNTSLPHQRRPNFETFF